MIPTIEDQTRMRDEALPDHISINDNGERVFASCRLCGGYVGVWATDGDRADAVDEFMEQHQNCPGPKIYEEDEIKHIPPLTDEERCPQLGMGGVVIRNRRLP